VAVDAHLARAVAAAAVVADQVAVVVLAGLDADGVLELRDEREGGEGFLAGGGWADDAVGGDGGEGGRGGEAFEDEGVFARAAAQG